MGFDEEWEELRLELVAAIGDLLSDMSEATSKTEPWEIALVETAEALREPNGDREAQAAAVRDSLVAVTKIDEQYAAILSPVDQDDFIASLEDQFDERVAAIMSPTDQDAFIAEIEDTRELMSEVVRLLMEFAHRCELYSVSTNELSDAELLDELGEQLFSLHYVHGGDEWHERHIANGLASIICGQTWHDGKAYRVPLSVAEIADGDNPAEHHADPWGIGEAHWMYRRVAALTWEDIEDVRRVEKDLDGWVAALENRWELIEVLYRIVSRERFFEAAIQNPVFGQALAQTLDSSWKSELTVSEAQTIAQIISS